MKKQMISITERQDSYIKAEAERLEASQSDIIRCVIDLYIDAHHVIVTSDEVAEVFERIIKET